ncbi:hypothetical protein ACJX0J_038078, partial [Zea mays]
MYGPTQRLKVCLQFLLTATFFTATFGLRNLEDMYTHILIYCPLKTFSIVLNIFVLSEACILHWLFYMLKHEASIPWLDDAIRTLAILTFDSDIYEISSLYLLSHFK